MEGLIIVTSKTLKRIPPITCVIKYQYNRQSEEPSTNARFEVKGENVDMTVRGEGRGVDRVEWSSEEGEEGRREKESRNMATRNKYEKESRKVRSVGV